VGTPPPDRFVTEMRVGGLFHRTNAHITFGRNKNFLIGPNGSGKTTIVHILASCLRNDFTQLFELPFRTAEITLTGTVSPKETKVAIAQRYNTESGRRTLNVSITGDYQHSEDIELRATQQLPAWTGDLEDDDNQRIASTTAGLAQIVRLLTNTTWLSVHRGEIRQPGPVGQNLVDRHLDSISRRFAQFNSRRNTLLGNENTEFQRRMFLSFLSRRSRNQTG
jgi:energy-coupling factor transporter ATP-binding protein EcfA2